jgi:DNA-binding MarR family transcriptional regulator
MKAVARKTRKAHICPGAPRTRSYSDPSLQKSYSLATAPRILDQDLSPLSAQSVRAWLSVVRAYQACTESILRELRPLGLKVSHFDILLNLLASGAQTQQQLALRTYVVKSHMSGLLGQMIAAGWLKRVASRTDKRSNLVSLTPSGKAQAIAAKHIQQSVMRTMFANLTEKQVHDTEVVMQQVTAALEHSREEPA